jgi:holdfast attachment protein HfaA
MQTAVDPSTRDANGNRVLVDGMIVTGTDNSVYAYSKTLGAGDAYSGAGALGGATAIGNSLSVVVNGSYNTVIVHNNQTNHGNVTANANGSTATGAKGTDITGDLQF